MAITAPAETVELQQEEAGAQANLWSDAWRRLRRNKLAYVAAIYLAFLGLVAIVSIFWTPYSYTSVGLLPTFAGPTPAHPFGADDLGRDMLSRLMVGARISLEVGLGTQLVVGIVGVVLGLTAGYFRGWWDNVVSLLINIFYGIPDLLVALFLVAVVLGRSGLFPIIVAIASTRWMDVARLVRGQTLSIREREFIEAAKASGTRSRKIIFQHVFPNALGPIIVALTIGIPQAILFEAFLSFLGLGVPPPTPSWGSMAAEGLPAVQYAAHIILVPSIALSLTLMAFNFLGDGLRDALDPRQRR